MSTGEHADVTIGCNVKCQFSTHLHHVSVSPTDGIGATQGQRKTLTRVGIEPMTFGFDHRCSPDSATDGSGSWELKMSRSRQ